MNWCRSSDMGAILCEFMTTAAILAGGGGRRLGGVDKALIEIGGRPIIERQLAVLRPLFDEVLVVAGDPARYARFGARPVRDLSPGLGPLAGLEAALAAASSDAVVVVACDLPFLDAALVSLVRDHVPGAPAI